MMTLVHLGGANSITGPVLDIPFVNTEAASAAQMAISSVEAKIENGSIPVVSIQSGSDTIPAFASPIAVFISGASSLQTSIPSAASVIAINATAPITVTGVASNQTQYLVAGSGGLAYVNHSDTFQGFVGGGAAGAPNAIVDDIAATGLNPRTTQYVDLSGMNVVRGPEVSSLATLDVTARDGSTVFTTTGVTRVHALAGQELIGVTPHDNMSIITVEGDGGDFAYFPLGGDGTVTTGGGMVTIFGGSGRETVNALAGSATGSLTVVGGNGLFTGGQAGGNILFTSSVAGQSGLIGGGDGDVLVAQATDDTLGAGSGNATLYAAASQRTHFANGPGNSLMAASEAGGDTFTLGHIAGSGVSVSSAGNTTIFGPHASASAGNRYVVDLAAGATTVFGFLPGVDSLSGYNSGAGDPGHFFARFAFDLASGSTQVVTTDSATINFAGARVTTADVF